MVELLKKSLFFIVVIAAVFIFFFFNGNEKIEENVSEANVIPIDLENNSLVTDENSPSYVVIDVKGEVLSPGVYEINMDSRVNDVIQLAGGFLKDADQTMVNLAQKVHDEMIIFIPKRGEISPSTQVQPSSKLRLNYATQEEIEKLNGIGPSKAQAIIQYRDEEGYFQTVEDLLNISGIGEKTLENLKDDIQIP
ncbi:helix-hairpin-helix domain-containing protein [Virgibacillus byunsanensis]|uniref:Helix-hairpin-helix domain-containing protein n=1 Tax=Virgibacillus byunsanensis TaxID=570945 RepID=A0ABW3LMS1_9BACI